VSYGRGVRTQQQERRRTARRRRRRILKDNVKGIPFTIRRRGWRGDRCAERGGDTKEGESGGDDDRERRGRSEEEEGDEGDVEGETMTRGRKEGRKETESFSDE